MSDEEEAEMLMYGGHEASVEILGAGASFQSDKSAAEDIEDLPDILKVCEREVLRLLVLYSALEVDTDISVAAYLLNQLGRGAVQNAAFC